MADSGSESEAEKTIAEDVVVTKYKMAGDMANKILLKLIKKCVEGANAVDLCIEGDNLIEEETSKVFKKEKELRKGVAFPTCISVNNCVCHFSPLKSEKDVFLQNDDLVKIDLAVQIDGFIGSVAHTLVVGATKENPVKGKKADVIMAAYLCSEAALRLVKPGSKNCEVTDAVQKIAESFKCKPVEGMLSHQLQQNKIDGAKTIIQNPTEQQRQEHEKVEFAVHEVYAIDVLVSTGEGRPREMDARTTIYKRNPEIVYQLKMKASRALFSEVERRFDAMCFTLRAIDEEKKGKMGVVECVKHELLTPFPVLWEKDGEFVAQFKFTLLLMPNNPIRITSAPIDLECFKSEFSVEDPTLQALLNTSTSKRAAKKKKKKAASKAAQEAAEEAAAS